jgi:hypothetical protein
MIGFIWGALSDGYFWLGMVPGIFFGAWSIMQNEDYKRFQTAQQKHVNDAVFRKYLDHD